jgi:putative transposase
MSTSSPPPLPQRKRPAREAASSPKYTEHIFVTCCTRRRIRVLDNHVVHSVLVSLWCDRSQWSITGYVIMPDHIHLMVFASRGCRFDLRSWVGWWKAQATQKLGYRKGDLWLPDLWDTRMRSHGHFAAKLVYMRENPVRAGLVNTAQMWPFQGDLCGPISRMPDAL